MFIFTFQQCIGEPKERDATGPKVTEAKFCFLAKAKIVLRGGTVIYSHVSFQLTH